MRDGVFDDTAVVRELLLSRPGLVVLSGCILLGEALVPPSTADICALFPDAELGAVLGLPAATPSRDIDIDGVANRDIPSVSFCDTYDSSSRSTGLASHRSVTGRLRHDLI